jgi:hypothetical protein
MRSPDRVSRGLYGIDLVNDGEYGHSMGIEVFQSLVAMK